MQTADQQTAAEIQTQIEQVEREAQDITRSLDKLTNITDLLGAKAELRDRTEVLDLLQQRLQDAETREAAAAERARRQANTDAMEAARAAYEDVTDQFNSRRLALIRYMTAESDELDPLSFELQRLRTEFTDAWLRNNPDRIRDFDNYPKLPEHPLDLTEPEKHAQDALNVLYASRTDSGGSYRNLTLASMAQGYQRLMAGGLNAPQRQDLTQPSTALDDEMGYAVSRMGNRDD